MVFCLRYVGDDIQVHEQVIELHSMDSTSEEKIFMKISQPAKVKKM